MAFTSDDFAAFIAYAGPPPLITKGVSMRRSSALVTRLEYINKCEMFCGQYFDPYPMGDLRGRFYSEFMLWYRIRQEMLGEQVNPSEHIE